MKNCSDDLKSYQEDEVALASKTRSNMRGNRDANRDRLSRGLEKLGHGKVNEHVIQGSYAMKTMTQHPANDYDIDDGAAFNEDKFKDSDGNPLAPYDAKKRVKDALVEGGGLPATPKIKTNCVRIDYAAGHHIDIPVYRRILDSLGNVLRMELAGETWRESNPRLISNWFADAEKKTSNADDDDPQLRRLVRLLKNYARINVSGKSPSGLILTVLTEECHRLYCSREDEAFRNLLQGIKNRLAFNRVVYNPADAAEVLTKDSDTEKFDALVSAVGSTLEDLKKLDGLSCSLAEARKVWDKVFKTDYFSKLQDEDDAAGRAPYTPSPTEPSKKVNVSGPGTSA